MVSSPSARDQSSWVLTGPVCSLSNQSQEVFLKTLEDYSNNTISLVMWAHHLDGVLPTIRSRCINFWSPPSSSFTISQDELDIGRDLIEFSSIRDVPSLLALLKNTPPSECVKYAEIYLSTCYSFDKNGFIWPRVRKAKKLKDLTLAEALTILLGV